MHTNMAKGYTVRVPSRIKIVVIWCVRCTFTHQLQRFTHRFCLFSPKPITPNYRIERRRCGCLRFQRVQCLAGYVPVAISELYDKSLIALCATNSVSENRMNTALACHWRIHSHSSNGIDDEIKSLLIFLEFNNKTCSLHRFD